MALSIDQLTSLRVKYGTKKTDSLTVNLFKLLAADGGKQQDLVRALNAVVAELQSTITDNLRGKDMLSTSESHIRIRGLGSKKVPIEEIAEFTIGRALQAKFLCNDGVTDWHIYGIHPDATSCKERAKECLGTWNF